MIFLKLLKSKNVSFSRYSTILSKFSTKLDFRFNDSLRKKIIYNCLLVKDDEKYMSYGERKAIKIKNLKDQFIYGDLRDNDNSSICLKYLNEQEQPVQNSTTEEEPVQFPFENATHVKLMPENIKNEEPNEKFQWISSSKDLVKNIVKNKNWLPHESDISNDSIEVDGFNYNIKFGSVDRSIPVSAVNCGGCGALLHCQDTSIPGFLPKELFHGLNKSELKTLVCQRCHFLKEYDIALSVDVKPEDYPKILSPIKKEKALILLMVDLLDIPCSIWPGILDTIGNKRPIVLVANKVDLLVQDSYNFINNIHDCLLSCMMESGIPKSNIKHIELVSAKNGYGIENLITQIHNSWRSQGDIYIVGCTNVGKSTLFNSLIQSDLCKVQAVDALQRATVSEWPGTTLNLLKFPILRPSHWRLFVRKSRMLESEKTEMEALSFRAEKLKKSRFLEQNSLKGSVGRTFLPECPLGSAGDPFSVAISNNPRGVTPLGINPNSKIFRDSKWCYDTPGVVHPDQIVNLLTTQEIMDTLPKSLILPRALHVKPGTTIFIAGLARVDFLSGPDFIWLTVFAANTLPLTITKTEDADSVYDELLGTDIFKVPRGGVERLQKWPKLEDKTVEVVGKISNEASADLVLSSAGWFAVTLKPAEFCVLRAWTPSGRGIHLRAPLMKKASNLRGPRIRGTPVFKSIVVDPTEE